MKITDVHQLAAKLDVVQPLHFTDPRGYAELCDGTPAPGGLHLDVAGDSFRFEGGDVLPPEAPGLGMTLAGDIKNRRLFVPGSGEFNSVPGYILTD